jgi:mannose-6-phosphate isomerase-like protein (cupin superfamily)
VNPRHIVHRGGELMLAAPTPLPADGVRRRFAVSEEVGAAHTGFAICELDPGVRGVPHVHSYEESFFVLEGHAQVTTPEGTFELEPGDYGMVPVGSPHIWRNEGASSVRWAEMTAPQPRANHAGDTYAVAEPAGGPLTPVDVRDPRTRSFGHLDPENMRADRQTQDMLAVSASMRTALLVYSGITVKMMVDTDLGAHLATMFMVQYEPDGVAGRHDHPLEETYLILEGAVDATFDDMTYHLGSGDIAWAGAGCVHGFTNPGPGIVRWLETQAPQPPARHAYRFARDWEYLAQRRT